MGNITSASQHSNQQKLALQEKKIESDMTKNRNYNSDNKSISVIIKDSNDRQLSFKEKRMDNVKTEKFDVSSNSINSISSDVYKNDVSSSSNQKDNDLQVKAEKMASIIGSSMGSTENVLEETIKNNSNKGNGLMDYINYGVNLWKTGWDSLVNNWNTGIEVIGKDLGKNENFRILDKAGYIEPIKVALSSIGNANVALTKGIANVVEGAFDALMVTGGVLSTPVVGLADLIAYGTGNDLGLTNKLWNETIRPNVENKLVDNLTDSYYSGYGKVMNDSAVDWLKKDSLGFNITEQVGGVLGTLAGGQLLGSTGVFGPTAGITSKAGIRSAVTMATTTGFGHGTENAWNDGANTDLGILYGAARGGLDGLQYWLGGQINKITLGSGKTLLSKLGSAGFRVLLDGADGSIEVPAESLFKTVYNGKSFDENFNESGGWGAMLTQFLLGSGLSFLSESGGAFFNNYAINKVVKKMNDEELTSFIIQNIDDKNLNLVLKKVDVDKLRGVVQNVDDSTLRKVILSLDDSSYNNLLSSSNEELRKRLSLNDFRTSNRKYYSNIIESSIKQIDSELGEGAGIAKLNEIVKTGDYSQITDKKYVRQNLQGIPKRDLEKYLNKYKSNNLRSYINNTEFNKKNLITGIINQIPDNLNEESKIRTIYIKLNQAVDYSDEFFSADKNYNTNIDALNEMMNKKITIDNVESNKVVCSNWSEMYKDLLTESGIDQSRIEILGKEGKYHKFVKVKLDNGKVLIADGTKNFNGFTDLVQCKYNLETKGFFILNESDWLTYMKKNDNNVYGALNDVCIYNSGGLEKIDKEIGYNSLSRVEQLDGVKKLEVLYGNINNLENIDSKIKSFIDIFDNNGSAVDSFSLYRIYCYNFFGQQCDCNLYVNGKDTMTSIKINLDNASSKYLVKLNDEKIKIMDNDAFNEMINSYKLNIYR